MSSVNNSNLEVPRKFKWPEDLSQLGLTEDDRQRMEIAINLLGKGILSDGALSNQSLEIRFFGRDRHNVTYNGLTKPIPRSMYIMPSRVIVLLNGHNGAPVIKGGAEQGLMKLAYDPIQGQYLVKKKVTSIVSGLFYSLLMFDTRSETKDSGFAEIALYASNIRSKSQVFEVKYDEDLATRLNRGKYRTLLDNLLGLQKAIRTIHGNFYQPAMIGPITDVYQGHLYGGRSIQLKTRCFHGDISPRNILCEEREDTDGYPVYKLSDLGGVADVQKLTWTPGWGSPETVGFAKGRRYQNLSVAEFNQKYGTKRDAWSFGLIVLTLLRGQGLLSGHFPNASFIANRVKKDDATGEFDDSEIMNVTQEEVDAKINDIEASLSQGISPGLKQCLEVWCNCLRNWLKVNPDERRDLLQYRAAFQSNP